MTITWSGHYTIKLYNSTTTIIINPYSPEIGLPPFRSKADFVFLTNPAEATLSHLNGIQGDYAVINSAGEYSFDKISAYGIGWFNEGSSTEQIIYRILFDGLSILYLGSLSRALKQNELEQIELADTDVLIVPIGGSTSIDTATAIDTISTIEPNVIIPINHMIPKLRHEVDSVSKFAHEMGVSPKSDLRKVTLSASKIDRENMATIILGP
jgi:L-ascorbate metabolism protein UlaG (beta-lactamase superfamily)